MKRNIIIATLIAAIVVAIIVLLTNKADAKGIHTEWKNVGQVEWSGECSAKEPACGQSTKGTEYGKQKQECKIVSGHGKWECFLGQKRTVEVKRCCRKVGEECEAEGVCPTDCGLEASEVPDGKGGVKLCEATEACPVEPEPVVKKKSSGGKS